MQGFPIFKEGVMAMALSGAALGRWAADTEMTQVVINGATTHDCQHLVDSTNIGNDELWFAWIL